VEFNCSREPLILFVWRASEFGVTFMLGIKLNLIIKKNKILTSILSVCCYGDIFQKYKNSYLHVKNKEIKIKKFSK
jgi:hypothetical protein